eukprot:TRINITY_DN9115_c0_g1_i1.p1 TRINITY_DN9115_c0_g1~~TRINITY_DN9115_c0_g1_i1.p1  ORF type:complete len:218 (-),score=62.53 TRINITY_DN9115_c0_g1_i1:37-690(-)
MEEELPLEMKLIKEKDEKIMFQICENTIATQLVQKFSQYLMERSINYGRKLNEVNGEIIKTNKALEFQDNDLKSELKKFEVATREARMVKKEYQSIMEKLNKAKEERESIQNEIQDLNTQLFSEALKLTKEQLEEQEIVKKQLDELTINKMQANERMVEMKKKFFEWLTNNTNKTPNRSSSSKYSTNVYHTTKRTKSKQRIEIKNIAKRLSIGEYNN